MRRYRKGFSFSESGTECDFRIVGSVFKNSIISILTPGPSTPKSSTKVVKCSTKSLFCCASVFSVIVFFFSLLINYWLSTSIIFAFQRTEEMHPVVDWILFPVNLLLQSKRQPLRHWKSHRYVGLLRFRLIESFAPSVLVACHRRWSEFNIAIVSSFQDRCDTHLSTLAV